MIRYDILFILKNSYKAKPFWTCHLKSVNTKLDQSHNNVYKYDMYTVE